MLVNNSRKLATIRKIDDVVPIPNADAIELAVVGGWKCVIKKGTFKAGDKAVYIEIDSLLPVDREEFNFLQGNRDGLHRLRTIKLRGQISQGLLIPAPEDKSVWNDLDSYYGITKYEIPEALTMNGDIKGLFPSFIPKTDLERIQNLETIEGPFYVSAKLDGTSLTCYRYNGEFGVCSRNLEKKETEHCIYWKVVKDLKLDKLLPEGFAIQGEVMGPNIQGNRMGLVHPHLFIFDVYDIVRERYLLQPEMLDFLLRFGNEVRCSTVPIFEGIFKYTNMEEALKFADEIAASRQGVEGVACKSPNLRFKIISNNYLLKIRE